ncbi:hypothetical protein RyT2_05540 [Pseudolactococcus yaeyamensis]
MQKLDVVKRHRPHFTEIDYESPLSVGNGNFCFNTDITGFQTLYDEYLVRHNPLCIMSHWGWHTAPNLAGSAYTYDDLELDVYPYQDREVYYPVTSKSGNEAVYHWLRQNQHRANLATFRLIVAGTQAYYLKPEEIQAISQTLYLDEGRIVSNYEILGDVFTVETLVDSDSDTVHFRMKSEAFKTQRAKIEVCLPYPNHEIQGGRFDVDDKKHEAQLKGTQIKHTCDDLVKIMDFHLPTSQLVQVAPFIFEIQPTADTTETWYEVSVTFSKDIVSQVERKSFQTIKTKVCRHWQALFNSGSVWDFPKDNPDFLELERRSVLSIYQLALHSSGAIPSQETGLLCNSWYGKFHLEMVYWHTAYAIESSRIFLVLPQLAWFKTIIPQARWNAKKNGFKGLRWPKMIDPSAIDSPSEIAPLLVWQQTHLVTLLDLVRERLDSSLIHFMQEYWEVVEGTLDFVCDFLVYDATTDTYNMVGPVIPSQEEFEPMRVKNPTFEMSYWRYGLTIGLKWARILGKEKKDWQIVHDKIALVFPTQDGLYPSHQWAQDTFPTYMKDHPTQLAIYGLFPNEAVDTEALTKTLDRVLAEWDEQSMWGWDYGYMAILANRLGQHDLAVEILLKACPKNYYAKNGHNYQKGRVDLPAYLPGNGALLLAIGRLFPHYRV